ncbi:hypothetical protein [Frankia sp. R82]|uniref:hypothetical protein n=1 Tax=Frankia sp. R82 TaxID=2950553 RepID=UPI002043C386|nr:hypothetical protein [Frankia sp. R82]MCM3884307.1 hypothetical protein [Frankia sp. R82]
MDEHRFVVWDADGRPLGAYCDFDTAHRWAHLRRRQAHTRLPLTLDDRVAQVSRRLSHARCELVAWAEFAVLPGCDLPPLDTTATLAEHPHRTAPTCVHTPVIGHPAPARAQTTQGNPA